MNTIRFIASVLLSVSVAAATTIISVQSGGIGLNSQNTASVGSVADPWLIDETMTAGGILIFNASDTTQAVGPGNPTGSFHSTGRWIRKTVLNNTPFVWTSFEIELQEALGTPSGQGDGLSFADGDPLRLTFSSNLFSTYTRIDTTRDYLNFSGGTVNPGQSVTFEFAITDNSPVTPIYLAQTPNVSDIPEPTSLLLVGCGLVATMFMRRGATR